VVSDSPSFLCRQTLRDQTHANISFARQHLRDSPLYATVLFLVRCSSPEIAIILIIIGVAIIIIIVAMIVDDERLLFPGSHFGGKKTTFKFPNLRRSRDGAIEGARITTVLTDE
jgi:hypothetical protein